MHKSKILPRRRSHILLPQLIKKIKPIDYNKQNTCAQNITLNVNQKNNNVMNKSVIDKKIKNKQCEQNSQNLQDFHKKTREISSKVVDIGLNQSTDRTLNGCSQSEIQQGGVDKGQNKEKDNQLHKLQILIRSDKMFVNPDRWNQYLKKAINDDEFQKALDIFLYSYFIQHYN